MEAGNPGEALTQLLPALECLDRRLERAVAAAQLQYGLEGGSNSFRGLYIGEAEVARLLAREPGAAPLGGSENPPDQAANLFGHPSSPLGWLQTTYNLTSFDLEILIIALAPELDLRYERLYAYLQDDVSRRRPSVDLALNLLCGSAVDKMARRAHFEPEAPLRRHGLVQLISDPQHVQPPLLAQVLKLDDQIVRRLLGEKGLDPGLAACGQLITPPAAWGEVPWPPSQRQRLVRLAARVWREGRPLRLFFHGPGGTGKQQAAAALAGELKAPLLILEVAEALNRGQDFRPLLRRAFREARMQEAILCLAEVDRLQTEEQASPYRDLILVLSDQEAGIVILTGLKPWTPPASQALGVLNCSFSWPDFEHRRQCWQLGLAWLGWQLPDLDLDDLAGRFSLTPVQIREATLVAGQQEMAGEEGALGLGLEPVRSRQGLLFAAARSQCGHELQALTHRLDPRYTWGDIVLPEDTLAQLRELCQRAKHRHRVLEEWGFDGKLSLGKGTNALFAGPSGTGKTMAAEIIARELGLDLYKIDLPGVVSKYIGETEKNLDRIFSAAQNANAILFFDEADALFGKRSEVKDSHDRYANIEISYLLQKMEEYEGLAILATNMRQHLDEAFIRRLAMTVLFPFPDEASRRRIWDGIWPRQTPLAKDMDLEGLARKYKLSGGNIKNIALAAAFLAAADGGEVAMGHLLQAVRREYQKMGKAYGTVSGER